MPTLSTLANMAEISNRMLEHARSNDWDALSTLERELATLRQQAQQEAGEDAVISAQDTEQASRLIEAMLADDAEIRKHVEPWMESTRKYLSQLQRGKSMNAAYGTMSG